MLGLKTRRSKRSRRAPSGRRSRSGASSRPSALGTAAAGLLAFTAPLWLLALRPAAAEVFAVGGYGPDLLPLAVAVVAWTRPAVAAILFAAFVGCASDVTSGMPWGFAGAQLAVLAGGFASLRHAVATELPGTRVLLVGAFLLIERFLHLGLLSLWVPGLDLDLAAPRAFGLALITALFAPLAFAVASSLDTRAVVAKGRLGL